MFRHTFQGDVLGVMFADIGKKLVHETLSAAHPFGITEFSAMLPSSISQCACLMSGLPSPAASASK